MSTQISERLHKNTIYKISSYSEITSVYTDFKRDGYIISSWNTKEDGTGTKYRIGQEINILSDNIVYAQWSKMKNLLYFQSEEDGSKISLTGDGSSYEVTLVSSENGTNWGYYTIGDTYTYPSVGSKFYLRKADSDTSDTFPYKFSMSGKIAAHGNIQWLLDCTGQSLSCTDSCYRSMFKNCASLTQSPELPATTLATNCYNEMFYGCTSLSSAPELPAKTLAINCYSEMFLGCTSLTRAPVLDANTLAVQCYQFMFEDCNHLSVTTDSSRQGSYCIMQVGSEAPINWSTWMFEGTAGDFTGTPETGVAYYCYGN